MLLTGLLLVVSTQAGCRSGVESDGGVAVLSLDLDGDPVPDEVRVFERNVELRLSKPPTVTKLDLNWEIFGGMLVPLANLPLKGSPHREEALRFIEDSAFWKTCTAAEPSLQRLLQQRARVTPLKWIDGPVQPPFGYVLRQKDSWLLYRWFCYSPETGAEPFGPSPLREVARDGKWSVSKSCHGVAVTDLENNRFAWLYLLDQPIDKLRHSSIGDVSIAGGVVTIALTLDLLEPDEAVQVKVRLADGSITVVKPEQKD